MTTRISCYDCRYFSAGRNGRAGYKPVPPMDSYQEGVGGCCHRLAPQHGQVVEHPNGQRVVGYGQWPRVFTHDWCGEFEPRAAKHCGNAKECACANGEKGESYCE